METKPEVRRRNPVKTRERILAAATDLFVARGYAATGIRDIAGEAGVASSLLLRHFGSKANLFKDALVHSIYTRGFFVRDKAGFGERMAAMIASDRDTGVTAMMVLAIADPESHEVAADVSKRVIVASLADWLGPPDARARALNMLVLMNGFVIQTRYLDPGPAPAESVQWLARGLQSIVDDV